MDEAILMASSLLVGAGAGALLTYARDRNMLQLYANLASDLSRMVRRANRDPGDPPPAARVLPLPSTADLVEKKVS